MLSNQTFMVEFATLSNRVYYVEYCGDLTNWIPAQPAVVTGNSAVQWIDNGPPGTQSAPANTSMRFYRVILLP
jgi:hypothetical protein